MDAEFVKPELSNIMREPEWQKYMAALYFNVYREKALHLLLGPQIEKAFADGDGTKLRELQQSVNDFIILCGQTLDLALQEWQRAEPEALAKVAFALDCLQADEGGELGQLMSSLADIVSRSKGWNYLDAVVGHGIAAIFRYTPSEELATVLLRNLMETNPYYRYCLEHKNQPARRVGKRKKENELA